VEVQRFLSRLRRCIDDYNLINEGDKIAVGLSGGKDSTALLLGLSEFRRFYPKSYELFAITADLGFEGMDFTPLKNYCADINVPYKIIKTDIKELVFDVREEKNPCSLCSKMRKGALNDAIKEEGIKKLALGHHFDDAIETCVMSLFLEGRFHCFKPLTYMSRADTYQIRPMLYVRENELESLAETMKLPIIKSSCPVDRRSKREEIKQTVAKLEKTYPDIRQKIFTAIKGLPLEGWEKSE
jgi:tRNA 2-thiocytidine biosynthesis protein TtcA